MADHGRIVCRRCGGVVAQCRCPENHRITGYGVCGKCSGLSMPERDALSSHLLAGHNWPDVIAPNPCVVLGED
jgi:hypothetical protein